MLLCVCSFVCWWSSLPLLPHTCACAGCVVAWWCVLGLPSPLLAYKWARALWTAVCVCVCVRLCLVRQITNARVHAPPPSHNVCRPIGVCKYWQQRHTLTYPLKSPHNPAQVHARVWRGGGCCCVVCIYFFASAMQGLPVHPRPPWPCRVGRVPGATGAGECTLALAYNTATYRLAH